MLARDKKEQAEESELATAKKELADAKPGDLEKFKKHAAALSETIDLNQHEIDRLQGQFKDAQSRVEQLQNENRLLQNENARLKK